MKNITVFLLVMTLVGCLCSPVPAMENNALIDGESQCQE